MSAVPALPVMRERPQPGPRRSWSWPHLERTALLGGLALLSCHVPGRPVTSLDVIPGLRPHDDPAGCDGLSDLTISALLEGSGSHDAGAFAAAVEAQGATLRAGAGALSTRLHLDVPTRRLDAGLALLGQAMAVPRFAEADIARLVNQRLDEIVRERASPEQLASEALQARILQRTDRLSRPVGGAPESVSGIDGAAVAAQWSGAARDGAVVVLVGDLAGVDAPAVLNDALAGWTGSGARCEPLGRQWSGERGVLIVDRPGAVQTQLSLGAPGVGRADAQWTATQVATFALGGTLTSRLDRVLREDKGYTYGVRAAARSWGAESLLVISGSVETGVTAPALADLRDVLLAAVAGLQPAELEDGVDYLVGVAPLKLQSSRALVGEIATTVVEGLDPQWHSAHLARLRSLTLPEVGAACAQAWDPARLTWVLCGDAAVIAGPVEALGLGPVQVIQP